MPNTTIETQLKEFRKRFIRGVGPMQTPGGGDPQDAEAWIEADIEEFEDWLVEALESVKRETLEEVEKKVIGPDIPINPDYTITNPFRRMEEDTREHLNSLKHKQLRALKKLKESK